MPDLSGISHIDLTVTDRDRSERFYTDVLGFEVVKRVDKPEFRLSDMRHDGLDVEMCVRQPVGGDGSPFDELRTGLDHLSFGVASRTELEVWQAHLDRHGVTYTPIVDAPYGAVLVFRDSDNIQLELIARPGT
ncbi:MAG TPA: VOC family protein [Acidimicrobiia bacterium]|nr:VOC family protein [Acidimicrobiia bacterium]